MSSTGLEYPDPALIVWISDCFVDDLMNFDFMIALQYTPLMSIGNRCVAAILACIWVAVPMVESVDVMRLE
jgi:hypothetical protein